MTAHLTSSKQHYFRTSALNYRQFVVFLQRAIRLFFEAGDESTEVRETQNTWFWCIIF